MNQRYLRSALLAAAAVLNLTASAAPEVYFPSRLYVSGLVYAEPQHGEFTPRERSIGCPVQVWYFDDVCIASRTVPYVLPGSTEPPRIVYAYWYGGSAPDGDFWFQQWVAPGAAPIEVRMEGYLPYEAQTMNPLWHLLHYRMRNQEKLESMVKQEDQPATGTLVRLHDPSTKIPNGEVFNDFDYLVQDDRVLSSTSTIVTKVNRPYEHQQDEVLRVHETVALDFDPRFPAVPRKVKVVNHRLVPYSNTTFEVDQVEGFPVSTTPQEILDHLTAGLQRVHKQAGGDNAEITNLVLEDLMDGGRVRFDELQKKNQFLAVFVWASWAPEDLWEVVPTGKTPYGLLDRLTAFYDKHKESPDVEIIGVSLDVDHDAARTFAHKHKMPWRNYTVLAKMKAKVMSSLGYGELPKVMLFNRDDPDRGPMDAEYVLGSSYDTTGSSTSLERAIEEKYAAERAGGFARLWLGDEVIDILEHFESAEVLELTGDHMGELMVSPPTLPPPPMSGSGYPAPPQYTPVPAQKAEDLPTSIGVLSGNYPIVRRGLFKSVRQAREVARLMLDDKMVAGRGGEEALPNPKRAIVFRRGDDTVSLVYDGMLEVYLNDDKAAWLVLTEKGNEKFNELYRWLAKDAEVRID